MATRAEARPTQVVQWRDRKRYVGLSFANQLGRCLLRLDGSQPTTGHRRLECDLEDRIDRSRRHRRHRPRTWGRG